MLGAEYIKINNVKYTPTSFSYAIQSDENVFKSAAGTELLNIVRLNKHVFTLTWEGIDSTLLDTLEGYCKVPTVTFNYRSTDYTCRARGIAPKMLNKSYKYRRSDGLWDITITLTQL